MSHLSGIPASDGAGVKLTRVFGNRETALFDPFLMLDAFDSANPRDYTRGFPFHPHRGIETITYLIDGCIKHQVGHIPLHDSMLTYPRFESLFVCVLFISCYVFTCRIP